MKGEPIEWYQYEDLTHDWAFRGALIDALREIAEQLAKLNKSSYSLKDAIQVLGQQISTKR